MAEHAAHARRLIPGVPNLPGASFLADRLNDAVLLLSALPEIVVALRAIEAHIEHVDVEVTMMRHGVDRLEGEVKALGTEIGDLGSGINEVSASVGRLEPHVSDISRLTRPIKHIRGRGHLADRTAEIKPAPPNGDEEPPVAGFA